EPLVGQHLEDGVEVLFRLHAVRPTAIDGAAGEPCDADINDLHVEVLDYKEACQAHLGPGATLYGLFPGFAAVDGVNHGGCPFNHGDIPMRRCLFLLPVLAALVGLCSARSADKDAPEGFDALFNGKDLTGWKVNKGGNMKVWGAEKGVLFVD